MSIGKKAKNYLILGKTSLLFIFLILLLNFTDLVNLQSLIKKQNYLISKK